MTTEGPPLHVLSANVLRSITEQIADDPDDSDPETDLRNLAEQMEGYAYEFNFTAEIIGGIVQRHHLKPWDFTPLSFDGAKSSDDEPNDE